MTKLTAHPLAELFPMIGEAEYEEFKQDIKKHGQHEFITLYEGKILDGRNRYKACQELGIDCNTAEYTGNDAQGFVLSLNLQRRHLTTSQRAMVAARLANMGSGAHKSETANLRVSQPEAAEKLNVSERSVNEAKKAQRELPAKVIEKIDAGEISVSKAIKDSKPKTVGWVSMATEQHPELNRFSATKIRDTFKPIIEKELGDEKLNSRVNTEDTPKVKAAMERAYSQYAAQEEIELPVIPEYDLPKSSQEKLTAIVKATKRKLQQEQEIIIQRRVQERLSLDVLPMYTKLFNEAEAIKDAWKGIFTIKEYKIIESCLHPDKVNISGTRAETAFGLFRAKKDVLCLVKKITASTDMPTLEEMLKRRN